MKQNVDGRRKTIGCDAVVEPPVIAGPWTLSRLEIRTPLAPDAWPVARVDLEHAGRGRLTDIAVASGGVESMFKAIRQMVGLAAVITKLEIDYRAPLPPEPGEDQLPAEVLVDIAVMVGGETFEGAGRSADLLRSCASAYLHALSAAEHAARSGKGRSGELSSAGGDRPTGA